VPHLEGVLPAVKIRARVKMAILHRRLPHVATPAQPFGVGLQLSVGPSKIGGRNLPDQHRTFGVILGYRVSATRILQGLGSGSILGEVGSPFALPLRPISQISQRLCSMERDSATTR
jgi:hypothetical protein